VGVAAGAGREVFAGAARHVGSGAEARPACSQPSAAGAGAGQPSVLFVLLSVFSFKSHGTNKEFQRMNTMIMYFKAF
jgi:hypothetical protein